MQCVICKHGLTHPGKVTVTLQRGESLIIFKQVVPRFVKTAENIIYRKQSLKNYCNALKKP